MGGGPHLERGEGRLQVLFLSRGQHNVGALLRQAARNAKADAEGGQGEGVMSEWRAGREAAPAGEMFKGGGGERGSGMNRGSAALRRGKKGDPHWATVEGRSGAEERVEGENRRRPRPFAALLMQILVRREQRPAAVTKWQTRNVRTGEKREDKREDEESEKK